MFRSRTSRRARLRGVAALCASTLALPAVASPEAHLKVQLRGVDERAVLTRAEDGSIEVHLRTDTGTELTLTPEAFAERVISEQHAYPWWYRPLNITSAAGLAWVALGLAGQLLFTGRMLVQWLTSERQKRSVVPVAFWWMSLVGATMLLVYFVWRRDIVGILGQGMGWMIYLRNLWLIHRPAPTAD